MTVASTQIGAQSVKRWIFKNGEAFGIVLYYQRGEIKERYWVYTRTDISTVIWSRRRFIRESHGYLHCRLRYVVGCYEPGNCYGLDLHPVLLPLHCINLLLFTCWPVNHDTDQYSSVAQTSDWFWHC